METISEGRTVRDFYDEVHPIAIFLKDKSGDVELKVKLGEQSVDAVWKRGKSYIPLEVTQAICGEKRVSETTQAQLFTHRRLRNTPDEDSERLIYGLIEQLIKKYCNPFCKENKNDTEQLLKSLDDIFFGNKLCSEKKSEKEHVCAFREVCLFFFQERLPKQVSNDKISHVGKKLFKENGLKEKCNEKIDLNCELSKKIYGHVRDKQTVKMKPSIINTNNQVCLFFKALERKRRLKFPDGTILLVVIYYDGFIEEIEEFFKGISDSLRGGPVGPFKEIYIINLGSSDIGPKMVFQRLKS